MAISVRRTLASARRRILALRGDPTGALLLETLIAVTILMVISIAALVGLSTTQIARGTLERSAQAEYVTRNFMECIFGLTFQTTTAEYPTSSCPSFPSGYIVTTTQRAEADDPDLQRIIVSVGTLDKTLIQLETIRANQEKIRFRAVSAQLATPTPTP